MLKYKTVYLGIDCSYVSFCSQKLESGESNKLAYIPQSKWHLPRYTPQCNAATGSDCEIKESLNTV